MISTLNQLMLTVMEGYGTTIGFAGRRSSTIRLRRNGFDNKNLRRRKGFDNKNLLVRARAVRRVNLHQSLSLSRT